MQSTRTIHAIKRIALVAHDSKKKDLLLWVETNQSLLQQHQLFSTGTTGKMLEEATGIPVTRLLSGPLGGDQQIGAMIAEGKIDLLIFFWDPMEAQPHDSDVKALLRVGTAWNILMACDVASADFILSSPLMNQAYTQVIPDYSQYLNRKLATVAPQ